MTIFEIKNKIDQTSAEQVIKDVFVKIEQNADYNIFIDKLQDLALEKAKLVDQGKITGKLAGVPYALKDNFLHAGGDTTAASNFLKTFVSPIEAEAVKRLENEGAICVGAVNLDAFAHGGSTENSAFGVTKNAYDKTRVAGGSSGGSAVAVAREIVPFALGTDTGGSIRQPSSFNGVVGLKPTYGMVSRYGVVAMASGTDTVGVLASSVEDTKTVAEIIAGKDQKDMVTLDYYFDSTDQFENKRIAIIKEFMDDNVNSAVRESVLKAKKVFEDSGYTVDEVSLPILKYALAIYYVVVPAEISSNLGRYDGIRYGQRAEAKTLDEVYKKSRAQGFETENKRRIIIGSFVLSSGYYDAYYNKAQQARTILINEFNKIFEQYDALIGPVAPNPAFKIGQNSSDPITMYLEDVMTVPASLAGLPAVSIPNGQTEGLPIGLQIIGQKKSDAKILNLGQIIMESNND